MLWLAQFSQHLVLLGFVKLRSTVASKKELEPKGSKSAKLETFFFDSIFSAEPWRFWIKLDLCNPFFVVFTRFKF